MDDVKLVVPHRSSPFRPLSQTTNPSFLPLRHHSPPASSASAASAAIDPITAKADAHAITVQSDSVRAADQLAQNQIHHPHATPIQDQATVRPAPKSETSEDVDPQDPAKSRFEAQAASDPSRRGQPSRPRLCIRRQAQDRVQLPLHAAWSQPRERRRRRQRELLLRQ